MTQRGSMKNTSEPVRPLPGEPVWTSRLGLSVRARKAAAKLGAVTVAHLTNLKSTELLAQKNFGPTSLREVVTKLAAHGLRLLDVGPEDL